MPTIIDSLFLELGIDISKMPEQQRKALEKIKQFETEAKKSGKKSAQAISTVGEAFRDIASDSVVGGATRRLDIFATKLKVLGQTAQVSGGIGTPLGRMAEGLGALLSPAALGTAALGLLGKAAWDFNEKMTATNATIARQAMLSGMSAKNMWSWGQAARTVGAQPGDITGGIAGLQTAVTGMGIGASNATGQLVALARLGGIGWNFKTGVNIEQLFGRVHQLAKQRGYRNLGALRALTAPVMNDAMFNLATNPKFNPDNLQGEIKKLAPPNLGKIILGSLESQRLLGRKDIQQAALAERTYGAIQSPMDRLVAFLTNILADFNKLIGLTEKVAGWLQDIWNFIAHPGKDLKNPVAQVVRKHVEKDLIAHGAKPKAAAKAAGTVTSVIGQTIKSDFELAGKEMFAPYYLAANAPPLIAAEIAKWLFSKPKEANGSITTGARTLVPGGNPMVGLEIFGTLPDIKGMLAMMAAGTSRPHVTNNSRHQTRIGDIHVHTPTTDPHGHARAVRKDLSTHPLIDPVGQQHVTLATRGAG